MTLQPQSKTDLVDSLRKQGFNLFPLPSKSKTPNQAWKEWQTNWCDTIIPMQSNYAVVCGYNNLIGLDLDSAELIKDFEEYSQKTLTVKTGRGYHLYFKHNKSELPNTLHDLRNSKDQKIDVQSTGAFLVGPASIHPTGTKYEVVTDKPVLEIDFHEIIEKIKQLGFTPRTSNVSVIAKGGISSGNRNDAAFKYSCHLLDSLQFDKETTWYRLKEWNNENNPPLSENELKNILESAVKRIENKPEVKKPIPISKVQYQKISEIDEELKEENKLSNLARIEDPKLVGKKINVFAVVASNSIPYSVPSKIKGECLLTTESGHNCDGSVIYDVNPSEKANFVDIHEYKRKTICQSLITENYNFGSKCNLKIAEIEHTTIKKMRVRPIVSTIEKQGEKLVDDEGNEWKAYDIFLEQNEVQSLEAGKEIELTGIIIPDPKSQKISMIVSKANLIESRKYNIEKIKILHDYFQTLSLEESTLWITKEFENYSKIIKRQNVTLASLLTAFSPLIFRFDDKTIAGWVKTTVIGDTTTGKSETVKQIIRLLQGGQMVSGETASVAGLGATTTQASNNQWFVEWGPLVLQDRKLLAIDGAHKLNRNTWAELAESEREGKIKITKAAKGEAYARTRQIKIMNPLDDDQRTPKPMNQFYFAARSLENNFQIQNIARQDLVAFVSDDVKAEDRNRKIETKHDEKLEYLSDLCRMVWQQNYDIVFDEDAINIILEVSTRLENKFKFDAIPLITNDEKYKIAKLACSVAALTCSFNEDYKILKVTAAHVAYVADLKELEYHNAGLDVLAARKSTFEINDEVINDLIFEMKKRLKSKFENTLEGVSESYAHEYCKNILSWIAQEAKFTKDQLKAQFDLTRDKELIPLIAFLQNQDIIKKSNRGSCSTNKAIEIGKYLKSQN